MGSGGIPGRLDRYSRDPMPILTQLSAYLTANPARENSIAGITAAATNQHIEAFDQAQAQVDETRSIEAQKKQQRDSAVQKLYSRLSALQSELRSLFSPDDPRWFRFGFPRPADGRAPSPVLGLVLRVIGPGEVLAEWEPSALANNYRVTRRIVGVDTEPVFVGLVNDANATVRNLPTGTSVVIAVSARNEAGETLPTEANIATPYPPTKPQPRFAADPLNSQSMQRFP